METFYGKANTGKENNEEDLNTHFFRGIDAPIIVDIHFPLVESGNRKRSFPLRFGHASILKIDNRPTSKLK